MYAVVEIQPMACSTTSIRRARRAALRRIQSGCLRVPLPRQLRSSRPSIDQFRSNFGSDAIRADSAGGRPALAGKQLQRSRVAARAAEYAAAATVAALPPPPPPAEAAGVSAAGLAQYLPPLVLRTRLPPIIPPHNSYGGPMSGRLHVALERCERRLAAEHDAWRRAAVPIDGGANRHRRLARTCRSTGQLGRSQFLTEIGSLCSARPCSATRSRFRSPATSTATASPTSACTSTANGSWTSTATAGGTKATCGPSLGTAKTTCPSRATGTPTARPTSASSARRGHAIRGRFLASQVLPDADNFPTHGPRKMKNMPPKPEDATDGARLLKRTAHGKSRADLIDHVFHYGEPGDVPVAGDWNGDGIKQIGVFHDGQWYLDIDGDGKFTEHDAAFLVWAGRRYSGRRRLQRRRRRRSRRVPRRQVDHRHEQ